jgi:hypothetical protein
VHNKLNFNNISNIYNPKKKEPKRRKTRKASIDSNPPTPTLNQDFSITLINKGDPNGEARGKIIRSRSVDPKSPDKLENIPESSTEKGCDLEKYSLIVENNQRASSRLINTHKGLVLKKYLVDEFCGSGVMGSYGGGGRGIPYRGQKGGGGKKNSGMNQTVSSIADISDKKTMSNRINQKSFLS